MLDDLRSALQYFWNVDSNAPETTLGKGRRVVRRYLGLAAIIATAGVLSGALKLPDVALLSTYTIAPFLLDSSLVFQSLPLMSRIAPRAVILIELGFELGAVGVGISLSLVYGIYRKIGAASMTWSWFRWKRNR